MDKVPFLDQIVEIIVSVVAPDKIILFGSYARGDNRKDSDIDILVLKSGIGNENRVVDSLYMEFFNKKIRKPIDVIAMDSEKYDRLSDDIGYIYKTIKREGKVIYG